MLFGSSIASLYVQPHIGGDIALLTGVAKFVLEADSRLIPVHWPYRRLRRVSPSKSNQRLELDRKGKRRRPREHRADCRPLRAAKNAVIGWTMGITHHLQWHPERAGMIANLALLRGMVGRPEPGCCRFAGIATCRGWDRSGVTPSNSSRRFSIASNRCCNQAARHRPVWTRWPACSAPRRGKLSPPSAWAAICTARNPDAAFATQALGKLEMVVLPQHHAQHRPRLGHGGERR